MSVWGENIEIQAPLLSKLENKHKILFEFLFLILLVIIIMNFFKRLVIVKCNPVIEGYAPFRKGLLMRLLCVQGFNVVCGFEP